MADPLPNLAAYGRHIAWRNLLRGSASARAAKLFVKPVAYWRHVEYGAAWALLAPRAGERVLDLSSPKLFAVYLANRVGCRVVATDIEAGFIPEWGATRDALGLGEDQLALRAEDGRALSFADGAFDAAYSISVLEHIPGDGDVAAVRELARVLRPGGRLLLTVPFAPQARDEYLEANRFYWSGASTRVDDGRAFFQRRYDAAGLRARLVGPSGLRVAALQFFGEPALPLRVDREVVDYLPGLTGPLQPALARALVRGPAADWRELPRPLCAVLLLTKPLSEPPAS